MFFWTGLSKNRNSNDSIFQLAESALGLQGAKGSVDWEAVKIKTMLLCPWEGGSQEKSVILDIARTWFPGQGGSFGPAEKSGNVDNN